MNRFFGKVGYADDVETSPGVWKAQLTEVSYFGDVIRNSRQIQEGENLNPNLKVQNSISIVADAYANEHFHAIRYVEWAGILWTVTDVVVESPRLILRLGVKYNGPIPDPAPITP